MPSGAAIAIPVNAPVPRPQLPANDSAVPAPVRACSSEPLGDVAGREHRSPSDAKPWSADSGSETEKVA